MNPSTSNSQFLLLFHGPDWDRGRSREQTQQMLDLVMAWFDELQQRGLAKGGSALARAGTVISRAKGETPVDGPYAESKEILGGYLVLEVDDLDEAVAIARRCPTLDLGIEIEVRPMLTECPITARLREESTLATA